MLEKRSKSPTKGSDIVSPIWKCTGAHHFIERHELAKWCSSYTIQYNREHRGKKKDIFQKTNGKSWGKFRCSLLPFSFPISHISSYKLFDVWFLVGLIFWCFSYSFIMFLNFVLFRSLRKKRWSKRQARWVTRSVNGSLGTPHSYYGFHVISVKAQIQYSYVDSESFNSGFWLISDSTILRA